MGAAWYRRDVEIPATWAGRRVVITLERPHWKTSLWLDGRPCGSNDSLSVAHAYDLGASVPPGRHVITLRVDNSLAPDIGEDPQRQRPHPGELERDLVGRIEMAETQPVWIDELQAYPGARPMAASKYRAGFPSSRYAVPGRIGIEGDPGAGSTAIDASVAPDGTFSPNTPWDQTRPFGTSSPRPAPRDGIPR